jgi:hypothetical protein
MRSDYGVERLPEFGIFKKAGALVKGKQPVTPGNGEMILSHLFNSVIEKLRLIYYGLWQNNIRHLISPSICDPAPSGLPAGVNRLIS